MVLCEGGKKMKLSEVYDVLALVGFLTLLVIGIQKALLSGHTDYLAGAFLGMIVCLILILRKQRQIEEAKK